MWFPGAILSAVYIGSEILAPKKKWYIFSIYLVLSILFEIFLFLDPAGSVTYVNPTVPGEDLINDNLVEDSIVYFLALIFLLSIIVILGFGFLIKAIQTTGSIRKKFILLSVGAFTYTIGGILDGLFSPGIILIFIRAAMIGSAWMFYYGLKD